MMMMRPDCGHGDWMDEAFVVVALDISKVCYAFVVVALDISKLCLLFVVVVGIGIFAVINVFSRRC